MAYSPSLHGGSGSFNPSGTLTDYLTLAANNNFAFGTGDFTVEFWMNPTANSPWLSLCGTQPAAITDSRGWNIGITNGSPEIAFWSSAQYIPAAITLNQWQHIAVTRSGNTLRMFVGGTLANSTTNSENFTFNQFGVGCTGPGIQPYKGYISNLRVTKGLAVYTSNFTPPTSPVTLLSNGGATPSTAPTSGQVSLLCDFTNAGIFDNTKKNNLVTVGNAQISTLVKKYGTGSMYFDGTGDYLTLPSNSNFAFGTGDFTIEFWAYLSGTSLGQILFDQRTTFTQVVPTILIESSLMSYFVNGVSRIIASFTTTNTWVHVAVSRSGTSTKMFIGGTQVGSTYTDSNNYIQNTLYIGARWDAVGFMNGYIDDLRITKGVARYTANFTPPTQAFPNL